MINWIAGNWPDRFNCLVIHDGNLDERFAYFATEELWFPEWEHGGTPWENPQGYEKHNPVNFVKNWKTPMLVIHGAQDYPRRRHRRHRHLHRAPAPGHPEQAPLLPGREPLGAQAGEQHPLARHGARLAGSVDEAERPGLRINGSIGEVVGLGQKFQLNRSGNTGGSGG